MSKHPYAKRGFKLIELVIGLAIVAMLAALVITSVFSVRRATLAKSCMSNLYQIGVALNLYLSDYDQINDYWSDAIKPYLNDSRVWICPVDRVHVPLHKAASSYTVSEVERYYLVTAFYPRPNQDFDAVQIDPEFTMVMCDNHLGYPIRILTMHGRIPYYHYDTTGQPSWPFLLTLRFQGRVAKVHMCQVRVLYGVDNDQVVGFRVYPGMEDYRYTHELYYAQQCRGTR